MAKEKVYVSKENQWVDGEDEPVLVREGSVFAADHPLVVRNPEAFRAVDAESPVETATRAPGEKRSTRRAK